MAEADEPNDSPPRGGRRLRLPSANDATREAWQRRRAALADAGVGSSHLAGEQQEIEPDALAGNVEAFVGFARVPVGVMGPLPVRGRVTSGAVFVPLATTEGTLVMSFQHVANMLARGGEIHARCSAQVVWRAPIFAFASLERAASFVEAIPTRRARWEEATRQGSRHCRLVEVRPSLVGRQVFLQLGFSTGDAAGQNMVTAATQRVCAAILDDVADTPPEHWQIESNFSGDKKATVFALQGVRGRRATAEVCLSDKLCRRYFRADARAMARAWRISTEGSALSGTVGCQANYANALAALFIACGQDVACVAEAATGLTTVQVGEGGELVVAVLMPNLIVGTVGGGTHLPTARECLGMLGCLGEGSAERLAEICAAVALVGEVALIGAMAGGSYARAHAEVGKRSAARDPSARER